jgi:hypothetical protein
MKILNYIACTMNSNIENSIQLFSDLIENWKSKFNSNSWIEQLNSKNIDWNLNWIPIQQLDQGSIQF